MRRINTSPNFTDLKKQLKQRIGLKEIKNNSSRRLNQTARIFTLKHQQFTNFLEKGQLKDVRQTRRRMSQSNRLLSERKEKKTMDKFNLTFVNGLNTSNQTLDYHRSSAKLRRLTNTPRYQNITNRMQTQIIQMRSSSRDQQQIESMKNKILLSIFEKQPCPTSEVAASIPDKQYNQPELIQFDQINADQQRQQNAIKIQEIQEYITKWIDPVSPLLNNISGFMMGHKIPFRFTMFFMYKLFWLRRQTESNKIQQILLQSPQQNSASLELKKQNEQIQKCVNVMLEKLKRSKKWKQARCKHVFQEFSVSNQNVMNEIQLLTYYAVRDFNQLKDSDQAENRQTLLLFGCCYIVQIYDFIPSNLQRQVQRYRHLNQQNLHLLTVEQLSTILEAVDKQISIKF